MEKQTIARTIVLLVALVNQVLVMVGLNPLPFSDDQVYEGVTAVFTVVTAIWAWWKNNSVSVEAQEADAYLKHLKSKRRGK